MRLRATGFTLKIHPQTPAPPAFPVTLNMTHPFVNPWLAAAVALVCCLPAQAQERIYRCGNQYTNDAQTASRPDCRLLEGGSITIIPGTAVHGTRSAATAQRPGSAPAVPRSGGERVDSEVQRARDSDARAILEAELRKAQERLAQAQKAYADGAPEKQGIESRNHQRYLDRVAELKASLARAQSDVSGLQRELARFGGATGATTGALAR